MKYTIDNPKPMPELHKFIEGLPCVGIYTPALEGLTRREAVERGLLIQCPWNHFNKRAWIKHWHELKRQEIKEKGGDLSIFSEELHDDSQELENQAEAIDFPDHKMPENWLETWSPKNV